MLLHLKHIDPIPIKLQELQGPRTKTGRCFELPMFGVERGNYFPPVPRTEDCHSSGVSSTSEPSRRDLGRHKSLRHGSGWCCIFAEHNSLQFLSDRNYLLNAVLVRCKVALKRFMLLLQGLHTARENAKWFWLSMLRNFYHQVRLV